MLIPSLNSIGVPEWSLSRLIEYAASNGVPYVEIRGLENTLDLLTLPCFATDAAVARTRQKLDDSGVRLLSLDLSARVWEYEPAQSQDLRRYADLADRLSARYLRFFPGGQLQSEADVQHMADKAVAIQHLLKGYQVKPVVETHDSLVRLKDVLAVARAMGRDLLVLWDVVNMLTQGGEDWRPAYAALKPMIRFLHVKDAVQQGGQLYYRLLFEGELPLRDLLLYLQAEPEEWIVSLEWEKLWHPELADGEMAFDDYVRKIAQLRKIAQVRQSHAAQAG